MNRDEAVDALQGREYATLLAQAHAADARRLKAMSEAQEDEVLSDFNYYNEACANCSTPCCLHFEGGSCRFTRCSPRRAAYGILGGPC